MRIWKGLVKLTKPMWQRPSSNEPWIGTHFCKAGITVCFEKIRRTGVENSVENVQNPCKIKPMNFLHDLKLLKNGRKNGFSQI